MAEDTPSKPAPAATAGLRGPRAGARRGVAGLAVLADLLLLGLLITALMPQTPRLGLLPLGAVASVGPSAPVGPGATWHVGAGLVRSGGTVMALAQLPGAALALAGTGAPELRLFADPGASLQDLASVLDILAATDALPVRLMTRPAEPFEAPGG